MLYDKPLLKCVCGKKPKLTKNDYNYVKYGCKNCQLNTFHTRLEIFSRELWNSQIINISKLKVKI